jgi:hypothetical protein
MSLSDIDLAGVIHLKFLAHGTFNGNFGVIKY